MLNSVTVIFPVSSAAFDNISLAISEISDAFKLAIVSLVKSFSISLYNSRDPFANGESIYMEVPQGFERHYKGIMYCC